MSEALIRIQAWHKLLVTTPVQPWQQQLYEAFPASLGYSSRQRDAALFEAVFIMALSQVGGSGKELHKVYFFVPELQLKWAEQQFREHTKAIIVRLRDERNVPLIHFIGRLFHHLMLGTMVFALPNEPERWVSFGFLKDDHIPEWMRPKLLSHS